MAAPIERILRYVVIACGVLTVAGLVLLWPSGDRTSRDPALLDADPIAARVQSTAVQPCSYDDTIECSLATLSITEGETAGEVFTFEEPTSVAGKRLAAGDDVQVLASTAIDGTTNYS